MSYSRSVGALAGLGLVAWLILSTDASAQLKVGCVCSRANLIGDTVSVSETRQGPAVNIVVGNGPELVNVGFGLTAPASYPVWNIDIQGALDTYTIVIHFVGGIGVSTGGGFSGFEFTSLDPKPFPNCPGGRKIIGATVTSTNANYVTAGAASFTANSLKVRDDIPVGQINWNVGDEIRIKLQYDCVSTQACIPASQLPGMVAWWPGDGNANDIKGGNNGTVFGGTSYATAGMVGGAFSFDGVNDEVSILKTSNLNLLASDFSVDAWIKIIQPGPSSSNNSTYPIFFNYAGVPYYMLGVTTDGFKAQVYFRPGVHITGGGPGADPYVEATGQTNLNDGQWHHLVGTRRGRTARIFVDGKIEGTATNLAVLSVTVNGVPGSVDTGGCKYARIGAIHSSTDHCTSADANPAENHFPGLIDEVEVFNRALSPSQVLKLYNAGSAGKCK